ncbi:hypothetical protein V6N13_046658 [Hibiscus sabdariffa]|uniref:B box-type domain-containing protein n=1 Tax=Hibiscus sabdariffa TaxID=183260 RepID=A0ABR2NZL8_9ROSI
MKSCELCMSAATTYCESDQASLCWHCDARVHGANFLVARHVRCLLCHACQARTPWRATGFKFGRAVSLCETCHGEEEEEEADDPVVQRYTISNTPTPAPASSSPSSVDSSCTGREVCKRSRANASDLRSQVGLDCLSANLTHGQLMHSATICKLEQEADSVDSIRLSEH